MSIGMNKVFLMGNLGGDPELKHFASSVLLKLRIATTERYRDKQEAWQEYTQWHDVNIWGNRAEALERILRKGDPIVVEGRLETRTVEDAEGNKRHYTSVRAHNIHLAGRARRDRTDGPVAVRRSMQSDGAQVATA